jgi:hypothetical protein
MTVTNCFLVKYVLICESIYFILRKAQLTQFKLLKPRFNRDLTRRAGINQFDLG